MFKPSIILAIVLCSCITDSQQTFGFLSGWNPWGGSTTSQMAKPESSAVGGIKCDKSTSDTSATVPSVSSGGTSYTKTTTKDLTRTGSAQVPAVTSGGDTEEDEEDSPPLPPVSSGGDENASSGGSTSDVTPSVSSGGNKTTTKDVTPPVSSGGNVTKSVSPPPVSSGGDTSNEKPTPELSSGKNSTKSDVVVPPKDSPLPTPTNSSSKHETESSTGQTMVGSKDLLSLGVAFTSTVLSVYLQRL